MSATQTAPFEKSQSGFDSSQLLNSLENMGTNVFMSNTDLEITFVNKKAKYTLEAINQVLIDNFGFGADEIMAVS